MHHNINKKKVMVIFISIFLLLKSISYSQLKDKIELINYTYLGNYERNYYGNTAPDKLRLIWKINLGNGLTNISNSTDTILCKGARRTCQPLMTKENDSLFIIIGGCDHFLKKINVDNKKLCWRYEYEDVLNSTGTIWKNSSKDPKFPEYQIIQGSRIGFGKKLNSKKAESLRAISIENGQEIWRLNVKKTESISRDVDASCLIHGDSIFIGLENGIFEIINPKNESLTKNGEFYKPEIYGEIPLYNDSDVIFHQNNLITESSPAKLGNRIFIASGSGHIFGYNTISREIDWDYYIGADIDGSTIITKDSCILIGFEKQYLKGNGGVLKLNPRNNRDNIVEWFFPVGSKYSKNWSDGVIGSVGIDDQYSNLHKKRAAFIGYNGILYIVYHNELSAKKVKGPQLEREYFQPRLLYKHNIGSSVSTPIFVKNKLIAASSKGLWLFEIIKGKTVLLDFFKSNFEATPFVHNKRIYIASTDGYLYCFGE